MTNFLKWLLAFFLTAPDPETVNPEVDLDEEEDDDCFWCGAPADEPCNCARVYGDPDHEYDTAREERLENE